MKAILCLCEERAGAGLIAPMIFEQVNEMHIRQSYLQMLFLRNELLSSYVFA